MAQLQYVGLSHFRTISKKDFKDNDIDHAGVEFARQDLPRSSNPKKIQNVVEVSDEVADFLTEIEPKDWKVVTGETSEPAPDVVEVPNPQPEGVEPVVEADLAPATDSSKKPAPAAPRR